MASKANNKLRKMNETDRCKLVNAMKSDVDFLKKNGLMDYSLLYAVEKSN